MTDVKEKCMIPLDRIDSGLDLIARNIRRLLEDHYALMRDGSDWHAVALAIFALEELVKYYVLKRKKDDAVKNQMTSVEVEELLFGRGRGNSHKYKLDVARNEHLIPLETWTIHTAKYERAHYDSARYDTEDVLISAALRTQNIFVDWKEGEWEHGTVLEALRLKNFADSIIHALDQLETRSF
jgi:AbiV family abortive infection protein